MHTLASRIVPQLTSINPKTRVVALYSDKTSISLYRLNGELVWSVPARKQTSASALIWSPDGANIAVIYADGLYQILQERDGKVVQIVANQNAATLAWQTKGTAGRQSAKFQIPDTLKWNENLVLAVGSRRGELKVNLDGVLPLGALTLDASPVVEIKCIDGDFLVLTQDKLHRVEATYLKTYLPSQINDLVVKPTQVQKTMEQMVTHSNKLEHEQKLFESALEQFFNLDQPVESLYNAILTGIPDSTTAAWFEEMHEAGFKKWHKACSHYYTQAEAFLLVLVGLTERIIIYLGELPGVPASSTPSEILRGLYDLLEKLKVQRKLYLSFAVAVQSIYCSHLERALKVIDEAAFEGNALDWLDASRYVNQTLANPRILASPLEIGKLKTELDEFMAQIKAQLASQFQIKEPRELQGTAKSFIHHQDQDFILLKRESQGFTLAGPDSDQSLDCIDAFFWQEKLVLLSAHSVRVTSLELKEIAQCNFSFEAAACTIANNDVVVVSSDGLHFNVLELNS